MPIDPQTVVGSYKPFPSSVRECQAATLNLVLVIIAAVNSWVQESCQAQSQSSRALHPFFLLFNSFCPLFCDVSWVLGAGDGDGGNV